ncbi:G2/mitotic-specific cyclin-A-like isoform X2 [Saccoglossus kowalevskii]|uniref:G2/mitotic-specific cyclin-A-like isoform X1 n=1 Tax=Saccoglossus kowalevskii TaxID=10224 RepID=A0ABM0GV84_SACKO|nr:PREDICTED: G2/mitotic-specific cyclin-A-like isoform X1 [Saccoglossus kowalevskii]
MSYFGGASSNASGVLASSTATSFENQNPMARKNKREDGPSRITAPHASKRAALGTITGNTTRVQPFRAAKATTSDGYFSTVQTENLANRAGKGGAFEIATADQGFSIHVDQDCFGSDQVDSALHLNPAVVNLRNGDSLQCAFPPVEPEESPMVLDTSIEQICETDRLGIEFDLDAKADSQLFVPDYAKDIFSYLKEAEQRNRPKANYMKKQPDITTSMRCILVDWLVEVAEEYKLHNETLYLAVNYIDRFLSSMSVLRSKLQLVGAASMFLAAKFEEIYPPEVGEFVYITDDTYTKKQVLRMEHLVLKVLSFDLAIPTINVFLDRFLRAAEADSKAECMARFLAELTLQEYEPYIRYSQSTIAASAVCLANHTLHPNQQPWTATLEHYTSFTFQDILPCVRDLHHTFVNSVNNQQQAVREKYKTQKLHQVSLIPAPPTIPSL